jgi:hypothetical protein
LKNKKGGKQQKFIQQVEKQVKDMGPKQKRVRFCYRFLKNKTYYSAGRSTSSDEGQEGFGERENRGIECPAETCDRNA